ncbi:formyltetrahydrofolate deformylase [Salmonella enterica subsp. enterica serovar Enteritidis]|nr:formyltetrahydrofolate deformylase [Salmonella enterica subsp. enterica serovar Enteritidis]
MAALNSKVKKAVIPVAGLGTRMLPATKAIRKEMLPLVDKPLIQYVVNECIAAGITEIVLVTHSSKNSIENHFDTSFELEAMLEKRVKRQLLEEVQSICPPHVTIMQVRQGLAKGLGHAVLCAHPVVGNEPVAVILPDVILDEYESDLSQDNLAEMIRRFDETGNSQIMVTKEAHCLGDLLMKANYGGLDVEIAAVIGNHETLRSLVERFEIPFELVSHEGLTREEHDTKMADAIDAHQPDYVVLAKYMRVLTPGFVARFPNKIINIHHSFLPAFIGARPYHQAYERGVKIIGATAHYVNDNLDEGPIIMQDVIHVDHTYTAEDMMRAGRDVEKNVLSRALYQVLAQRVFVYGNRTIIL